MKTIYSLILALAISTQANSQACDSLHSQCLGTFSRNGYYFNLEAISDVTVSGISYLVQNAGTRDVSLYYRQGTYFGYEGVSSNWTLLGTDSMLTPVNAGACPIPHQPLGIDFSICIPQGMTYGFYLVMSTGIGTLETHNLLPEGSVGAQDAYLKLITGKGQFGIGDFAGALSVNNTFEGAIQYDCLCVTSVDDKQSADEISVYPNPAQRTIDFSGVNISQGTEIKIYNSTGVLVITSHKTRCDISSLSSGMYSAAITLPDGSMKHLKFIKE